MGTGYPETKSDAGVWGPAAIGELASLYIAHQELPSETHQVERQRLARALFARLLIPKTTLVRYIHLGDDDSGAQAKCTTRGLL